MGNETRRIRPSILQEDKNALAALKSIAGYTPANGNYTVAKLDLAANDMAAAQAAETQAQAAADAARDIAAAAEWTFHNAVLCAKDQVRAQFGMDSNEVQAIGLTKKSEKAKPTKRTVAPTP